MTENNEQTKITDTKPEGALDTAIFAGGMLLVHGESI